MTQSPADGPAGGAAAAGGVGFEYRVGAWVAARILAEEDVSPPWGLPPSARLVDLRCQASANIDDIVVGTRSEGYAFLQAKKGLHLEASPDSRLAGALAQFVQQFLSYSEHSGSRPWERPLLRDRDRLILVVDNGSSSLVRENLSRVLERLANGVPEPECAAGGDDARAWKVARDHLDSAWQHAARHAPTPEDFRSLASLIRIQTFALDGGETDQVAALDLLRRILADPSLAAAAWDRLCQHCQGLAEARSGSDRTALVSTLLEAGIELGTPKSFRESIRRLREHTDEVVAVLRERTEIRLGAERIHIQRPVADALLAMAEDGGVVVIGQPGSGKSATLAEVATALRSQGRDVVVLAADRLPALSLETYLGLDYLLPAVLRSWPGSAPAFLFVDGLDAAREAALAGALEQLLADVLHEPARWRLIVTIRTFDLRWSPRIQRLFAGAPHAEYRNADLRDVRHLEVRRLSEQEVQQISSQSSRLFAAVSSAPPGLAALLVVPFNLWLLAQLVEAAVSSAQLATVRTQLQLLELFWAHRVGTPPEDRIGNEQLLRRASLAMLKSRQLRAAVSAVATPAEGPMLNRILSSGILVPWRSPLGGPPEDQLLEFGHNILFDFSVQKLILTTDVNTLLHAVRSDPELLLLARPSFVMVLHALWDAEPTRRRFWEAVLLFAKAVDVPEIGKLQGPAVAANRAEHLAELEPLCEALSSADSSMQEAGEACLRHLVSALATGTGGSLVGPTAGPWAAFAERISGSSRGNVIYPIRVLLQQLYRDL